MSSARKLIYSKIPSSSTSTTTTTSTIPSIIVLENMGAARWTDVVEIYRLVQHFTHQILLSASSCSSKQKQTDTKNFCTFCGSNNSHNATLSKEIKDQISQSIHVPADSISQAVVRIPVIRTRTDENDDKYYDFQHQQPVDLLWHYGWTFSVIVPNPKYFSDQKQQMSMDHFCKQLQSLLSSFKPEGRRIPRGSAAQGNSKNKNTSTGTVTSDEFNHENDDKKSQLPAITTLPVEIIATLEENIPLPDIVKLFEAASPSVKLCGFPQIEANKKKLISIDNKKPFLKSPEIPGLFMLTDFITQEEENQLLNRVATWEKQEGPNGCWQTLNLRKVRHFGRRFDYSTNNVFEDKVVPLAETPWIKTLLDKIHSAMRESKQFEDLPQKEWGVDQMTVSEYTAGAGIPPHLDHPENFGEIVVAVATGAPTLFEFSKIVSSSTENSKAEEEEKNNDGAKEEENEKVSNKCSVLFPPRALMVMQGPSRYQWKHSIAARSKDYLFFLDEESTELITSNNKQDEKEGDKNRVANQYLSACSLERGRRISFTFRRVTMDEKDQSGDK